MRHNTPVVLALGLSGCASMVPGTLAWLSGQTPLDADPAAITVALVLPEGLRAKENGARMEINVKRFDTGEALRGAYTLAEAPAKAADFGGDDGSGTRFYAIKPADVLEMHALQDTARGWEGANLSGNREGRIGIGLDSCKTEAGPAPDAVASFYIRNDPEAAFKPLMHRARMTSLLGKDFLTQILPCAGAR